MSKDGKTRSFFHHTDRESAKKIAESGMIRQSDPKRGDARHGPGSYLTTKGPSHSPNEIAKNNYDGANPKIYEGKVTEGKTQVAIEVKIPSSKVEKCNAGGRDVYKYPGNIDFKSPDVKDVKFHVRDASGEVKTYTEK